MPIVAKSEMDRRRALAQNPPSNLSGAQSDRQIEPRPRRVPAEASKGGDPDQAPDPLWPEGSLSADRDYDAGKYRPPIQNRFEKGVSGNPAGRPKKALGLKTVIRAALSKKVDLRDATGKRRVAMIEALVHKLIELATKGNLRAIDVLLKLYTLAVPEVAQALEEVSASDNLTAADEAGLALLRDIILAEQKPDQGEEDASC